MELLMTEGKKTEKAGTLLVSVSQQEKKTDSELLEQIDEKLDLLLAAGKVGTEE